ncbi:MAG: hypothetical protein ABFS37_01970 [Acidobacteriota bacterium]
MSRSTMSLLTLIFLVAPVAAGTADASDPLYALAEKIGPPGTLEPNGLFGSSVAADLETAVVGAPGGNAAFVFAAGPDGWQFEAELLPPAYTGEPLDIDYLEFGHSVAVHGGVAVIGTPRARVFSGLEWYEVGAVCVFRRSAEGVWSLEQELAAYDIFDIGEMHFGASVAISYETIIGGAPDDTGFGEPSESGSAFAFTLVGGAWQLQQRITPTYQGAEDHFGESVDLHIDTAVIGAPDREVILSTDAGHAYIFTRSGTSWTQAADLTASDAGHGDHFGKSVSFRSPFALVGAPDDNHASGVDAGSAYAFTETGGVWSQQQKLVATDGEAGDRFGAAVDWCGGMAFIGAPDDNHGMLGIDAGSAYIFQLTTGTCFQDEKLLAPDGAISDHFGSSVAIGGTALVGSPFDEGPNVTNTGSAHLYLYDYDGGSWGHEEILYGHWGTGQFFQAFGTAIAVDADTMVVGTPSSEFQSAHVFVRDGDHWALQQEMFSQQGYFFDDKFGGAVDISGDTMVVGAYNGSTSAIDYSGRAYIYIRISTISGPVWELQQILEPSDAATGQRFGESVTIEGDTVMVGSPERSGGGGVYYFSRAGSVWSEDAILEATGLEAGDDFGFDVCLSGDLLAVGATGDDDAGDNAGAVILFNRPGSLWVEGQKLTADTPQINSYFGNAIEIDGSSLIVGARSTEVSGHIGAGAAHVFVEVGGVWSEQQRLVASNAGPSFYFGIDVAIDGDIAVIGSSGWDFQALNSAGAAYVFRRSGTIWTQEQEFHGSPIELGAHFGNAVAATTDGIMIGALWESSPPIGYGAVYFYISTFDRSDLAITVSDGQTEAVPGTYVTYDIVVANDGPNEALGATVTDTFPPELLGCSWTCVGTSGGVCTPGPVAGHISDTVDLPVGAQLDYEAACLIDTAASGDLINTASAAPPAGVADPDMLNNTAVDVDALTPLADLAIFKDNGTTEVMQGHPTTYTIQVANVGPSDAPASPVIDSFPPCLSDCSWTCTAGPGAYCPPGGAGDIDEGVDLPVGTSATFLATCTVVTAYGQCSNTAEIFAQGGWGIVDPYLGNNQSTDTDNVVPDPSLIFADGFESGDATAWGWLVE